jgi:lipopolysaccharide transport system ATP-binding protein
VWALRDISFEVTRGEVLGIIGRNGAGKSTLLKILSRITAPTTGAVRMDGRIAALLEVGTGFHQDLTGRENIYLNGAILGMSRREISERLDEIVEFSGCERYVDTPVKRYSSGMVVRLGFAVAAHLEPEILIVDEVLAVGDAEFQTKCLGKMQDVASHGRTVLFVSHNLAAVQNLCQTAVWLDNGSVAHAKDEVRKVVSAYEDSRRSDSGVVAISPGQHCVFSPLQIRRLELLRSDGKPTPSFQFGEPVWLRLRVSCTESMEGVTAGITIRSHGLVLATLLSGEDRFEASEGLHTVDCVIPGGVLMPGVFDVDAGASRCPGSIGLDYIRGAGAFAVSDIGFGSDWVRDRRETGIVRLSGEWARSQSVDA